MNSRIIALKLLSSFGLHGLIKANLFVDQKVICGNKLYDELSNEYIIEDVVGSKNGVVKLKISNYDTPEDVVKLRNKFLYIEKSALPKLPEDEFYIYEIIDSIVLFNENEVGKIVDVKNFGSCDLLEILLYENCCSNNNGTVFVPMNDDCIKSIDEKNQKVIISEFAFDNYIKG